MRTPREYFVAWHEVTNDALGGVIIYRVHRSGRLQFAVADGCKWYRSIYKNLKEATYACEYDGLWAIIEIDGHSVRAQ